MTADTPRRSFTLSEQEPASPGDEPRFFINGEAYPDVTGWSSGQVKVEVWEIVNDAEMDHPFHLHGTFFQVLDQPHLGWKDTVNVPRKSTVRIAVDFDNPGLVDVPLSHPRARRARHDGGPAGRRRVAAERRVASGREDPLVATATIARQCSYVLNVL